MKPTLKQRAAAWERVERAHLELERAQSFLSQARTSAIAERTRQDCSGATATWYPSVIPEYERSVRAKAEAYRSALRDYDKLTDNRRW